MRSVLVLLAAVVLTGFAVADSTAAADSTALSHVCAPGLCEHDDKVAPLDNNRAEEKVQHDDIPSHPVEDIYPFSENNGSIEAKGGGGGGGAGGGGARGGAIAGGGAGVHRSSASAKFVSNPFAVLRGPLALLNSVFTMNRAHASLGKSNSPAQDSGFVGRTL